MIVVGDINGKTREFFDIVVGNEYEHFIQLGDFGFGDAHQYALSEWYANGVRNFQVNFGNHDHTGYLDAPYSLGNCYRWLAPDMFSVRGAYSIDKNLRYPGLNWWDDEELIVREQNEVFDRYAAARPSIVLSHDCPISIYPYLISHHVVANTTASFLQCLLDYWNPDIWIFGHHHLSFDTTINGTRFICLNELETLDLDNL